MRIADQKLRCPGCAGRVDARIDLGRHELAKSLIFEAVRAQLLLGNDPDDTFEVASGYTGDPRVRCVRNEDNLGLTRNWSRCLELAQGPYVMVFGDDDLLDPGYLNVATRIFDAHPEVGLVYGPVRTIDSSGRVYWSYLAPDSVNPGADGILNALEELKERRHVDG